MPNPLINRRVVFAGRRNVPLTEGLLAYWKLDDAGAPWVDSIGTHALTEYEMHPPPTPMEGKINGAADCSTGILQSASPETLNCRMVFTVSCWVQFSDVDGEHTVLAKNGGEGDGETDFRIFYDQFAGCLAVQVGDQTLNAQTFGNIVVGRWYFVAAGLSEDGKIWISINGTARNEELFEGSFVTLGAEAFFIGVQRPGYSYLNGYLDDVAFWNRELNGHDLARLWFDGQGSGPTGDVGRILLVGDVFDWDGDIPLNIGGVAYNKTDPISLIDGALPGDVSLSVDNGTVKPTYFHVLRAIDFGGNSLQFDQAQTTEIEEFTGLNLIGNALNISISGTAITAWPNLPDDLQHFGVAACIGLASSAVPEALPTSLVGLSTQEVGFDLTRLVAMWALVAAHSEITPDGNWLVNGAGANALEEDIADALYTVLANGWTVTADAIYPKMAISLQVESDALSWERQSQIVDREEIWRRPAGTSDTPVYYDDAEIPFINPGDGDYDYFVNTVSIFGDGATLSEEFVTMLET